MPPNKYRNIKVVWCRECDTWFRKLNWEAHLKSFPKHTVLYLFDSIKEAEFYQELVLRKKAGDIEDFKVKPKITVWAEKNNDDTALIFYCWDKDTPVNKKDFEKQFTYIPDFVIYDEEGNTEIIDVKSEPTQTPIFRLKKRILEAPGLKITIK